jgi:hypothetical protein
MLATTCRVDLSPSVAVTESCYEVAMDISPEPKPWAESPRVRVVTIRIGMGAWQLWSAQPYVAAVPIAARLIAGIGRSMDAPGLC